MERPNRVVIEDRNRLLDDFFKVDEVTLRHERFDGTMSESMRRLVFERGDSVAAVIRDATSQAVLLTEQFRLPTHEKGPGWVWELPAGMIDHGEAPEETLRREVLEETGFDVGLIEPISTFYLSPGGSSERVFLYFVEVTHTDQIAAGGGLSSEQEDIRTIRLPLADVPAALGDGSIQDAKTLMGLMWLMQKQSSQP